MVVLLTAAATAILVSVPAAAVVGQIQRKLLLAAGALNHALFQDRLVDHQGVAAVGAVHLKKIVLLVAAAAVIVVVILVKDGPMLFA